MRSALFAAGLITVASASKGQQKRQEFSLPVEPGDVTTLPGGEIISSQLLGTFTDVVPVPTDETSVSVSVSPSVSVSISTDTVTSPSAPTSGSATTTITTTESTVTDTATETTGTGTETGSETGTETGDQGGEATSTDDEDAAPMATPFAGAVGAMAAVGIAMAL